MTYQKENKKLVFISTRKFWPISSGKNLTSYYFCKGLHEKFGYDIYVFCFTDNSDSQNMTTMVPTFIKRVEYSVNINICSKLLDIAFCSFNYKQMPIQCMLYHNKKHIKQVEDLISSVNPSAIIVDMIRLIHYVDCCKNKATKKISLLDDDLAKRYTRQLDYRNVGSFIGRYSNNIPNILNIILNIDIFKKIILKREITCIRYFESLYINKYDYFMFVSSIESKEFNIRYNVKKAITVTVGVDYLYYSEAKNITKLDNTISFIGNFNVAANVDSLEMIINSILPLVKSKYTFHIIGQCPYNIIERHKDNQNIIFHNRVDDIRRIIGSTMVFLAPISYGTGIKTKIIEAMSMYMPVVTNSIGAEGISAKNGHDFYVIDNVNEIAEQVDILLNNSSLCKIIGNNANKFVRANHQWNMIYDSFNQMHL